VARQTDSGVISKLYSTIAQVGHIRSRHDMNYNCVTERQVAVAQVVAVWARPEAFPVRRNSMTPLWANGSSRVCHASRISPSWGSKGGFGRNLGQPGVEDAQLVVGRIDK
jgi:hypothetical protein